ncbi:MAG: tRNA (guanosine(37)-N1)-methyltransferase TrmD [Betaproteobacteria bacterium]|nr:tRNA (guanosine(37)-N1)-methyltransferase TrmD [Betaproteobacteria bacterium]
MRIDCLTLLPELVEGFVQHGVIRRAFDASQGTPAITLQCWNPRDFAQDVHRTVDDRPYGGGPGMVMLAAPLEAALRAAQAARQAAGVAPGPVLLLSPAGAPLTHARVMSLVHSPGAVLVCGRYEGVDQRFIDRYVDQELSLGDFVLSGGELGAMALLDAVARQLPGVLHTAQSAVQESFADGLLDCPHYSRPELWQPAADGPAQAVPPVLLSGHHAAIARWRRDAQLRLTAQRRPDLIAAARAAGQLSAADEAVLRSAGTL